MSTAEQEIHDAEFEPQPPSTREDHGQQTEPPEPSQALVAQPAQMLARAIDKGMDIDTITKLMDLYERWEAKQALKAFNRAMTKFQSLVPEIPKDKQGYSTPYAPLGTIDRAIKDAMEQCGLSKTWRQVEGPNDVTVISIITHEDGHSKEHSIGPVPWDLLDRTKQMNALQHRAATLTYLQRYSLIGNLGLTTADVDTDGGQKRKDKRDEEKPQSVSDQLRQPRAAGPRKINQEEADQLGEAATESGIPKDAAKQIVQQAGFEKTSLITVDKFPAILEAVKKWTVDPEAQPGELKVTAVQSPADPDEIEQRRIRAQELLDAVIDAGYKGNTKVLLKSASGERDLVKVPPDKLPGLITRLESELRGLRAMAN